jgi:virulence-associated protein VagC
MNGRSQCVRIPAEFRFKCEEVEISKDETGSVILKPVNRIDWKGWYSTPPAPGADDFLEDRFARIATSDRDAL